MSSTFCFWLAAIRCLVAQIYPLGTGYIVICSIYVLFTDYGPCLFQFLLCFVHWGLFLSMCPGYVLYYVSVVVAGFPWIPFFVYSCTLLSGSRQESAYMYTECTSKNMPDFGRVFLMLKYTDITQNTDVQSWTVTEIMAREIWNFDSCYTLVDYQIHI